jgi:hypothetical protein
MPGSGLPKEGRLRARWRPPAGERFEAKFGRIGFRRNFAFDGEWNGKRYGAKQVEAYAVEEEGWLVITVIVKFF